MNTKTIISTIIIIAILITNTYIEVSNSNDVNTGIAAAMDLNMDYWNVGLLFGFILKHVKSLISIIY